MLSNKKKNYSNLKTQKTQRNKKISSLWCNKCKEAITSANNNKQTPQCIKQVLKIKIYNFPMTTSH